MNQNQQASHTQGQPEGFLKPEHDATGHSGDRAPSEHTTSQEPSLRKFHGLYTATVTSMGNVGFSTGTLWLDAFIN